MGGKSKAINLLCYDCRIEFSRRVSCKHKNGIHRCRACSNIVGAEKRSTHRHNNLNSRLHVTWSNMKRRCVSPIGKEKRIYKGISLFADWHSFVPFMNWALNNGYADDMTIDRIDPKDGYHPQNCRFVDHSTQSANRKITDKNKSGFIGVWFDGAAWVSKVQWKGVQHHIGRYKDKTEAAIKRDEYVINNKLPHTLNFPE